MPSGAITNYIDVAQLTLYAFWIFFFCLIFYLRREDKREGYPLIGEGGRRHLGFPAMPPPKSFLMPHGATHRAPSSRRRWWVRGASQATLGRQLSPPAIRCWTVSARPLSLPARPSPN
jgi:hypothetical protein